MKSIATPHQSLHAVLSGIKRRAESLWPDDYVMQVHEVEQQSAAYERLQQIQHQDVPQAIVEKLRAKAVIDWKDDYVMQLFNIDQQISAYKKLHQQ